MSISEKVAYLKGLVEGFGFDQDDKQTKVINAIIDILDDIAVDVSDIQDETEELYEVVNVLDEDLGELEELVLDIDSDDDHECKCGGHHHHHHDDEDDDDDDYDHEHDVIYEIKCPNCEEIIDIDESLILEGQINCPACGKNLEFDFEDEDGNAIDLTDEKAETESEKE